MDEAEESLEAVNSEAFFPHSSIFPVDSGVFTARNLAFKTPSSDMEVGTKKWVVSQSMKLLTVTSALTVSLFSLNFSIPAKSSSRTAT